MKNCKFCNTEKDLSEFRDRIEKRSRNTIYKNNKCRECEKKDARIYYEAKKDLAQFKLINSNRASEYRSKNKDIIRHKDAVKRQKLSYRINRKQCILLNKEKITKQEIICKKRYSQYHKDNLTDKYVVQKLMGKKFRHLKSEFEDSPEMIKAKRLQIQILRLTTKN